MKNHCYYDTPLSNPFNANGADKQLEHSLRTLVYYSSNSSKRTPDLAPIVLPLHGLLILQHILKLC